MSASQETRLPDGLPAALRFHECILAGGDAEVWYGVHWSHYRHATSNLARAFGRSCQACFHALRQTLSPAGMERAYPKARW